MTTTAVLIWVWCVAIFPLTAILTFITTLVVCSQVPNKAPPDEKFPQISQLGTGEAHIYFIIGFVILLPQLLIIIMGRIQYLFQTQYIINRAIICIVHAIALISLVFMLIMAIVSVDDRQNLHLTGAYGMFGLISLYCFLHTIIAVYLYVRRLDAPHHSTIIWPLWFIGCSILLITCFVVWLVTAKGIPEYLAAASPFLYLVGFVPEFWMRARTRKRDPVLPGSVKFSNEMDC